MSKLGKKPVPLPEGIRIRKKRAAAFSGPKGKRKVAEPEELTLTELHYQYAHLSRELHACEKYAQDAERAKAGLETNLESATTRAERIHAAFEKHPEWATALLHSDDSFVIDTSSRESVILPKGLDAFIAEARRRGGVKTFVRTRLEANKEAILRLENRGDIRPYKSVSIVNAREARIKTSRSPLELRRNLSDPKGKWALFDPDKKR